MWSLAFETCGGQPRTVHLVADNTYRLGRTDCEISVEDKTVSRRHGVFHASVDSSSSSTAPRLTFADSSTYGSAVNGVACARGAAVPLRDGDELLVGSTSLRVRLFPLAFLASGAPDDDASFAAAAAALGAALVQDPARMTHLVVAAGHARVTRRLLAALARGVPVVSAAWVRRCAELARTCKLDVMLRGLPDPAQVAPVVLEGLCCDLRPNPLRARVLAGAAVLLLSDAQTKRLKSLVEFCGGVPLAWPGEDDAAAFDGGKKKLVVFQPLDMQSGSLEETRLKSVRARMDALVVAEDDIVEAIINATPLVDSPSAADTTRQKDSSSPSPLHRNKMTSPAAAAAAVVDHNADTMMPATTHQVSSHRSKPPSITGEGPTMVVQEMALVTEGIARGKCFRKQQIAAVVGTPALKRQKPAAL